MIVDEYEVCVAPGKCYLPDYSWVPGAKEKYLQEHGCFLARPIDGQDLRKGDLLITKVEKPPSGCPLSERLVDLERRLDNDAILIDYLLVTGELIDHMCGRVFEETKRLKEFSQCFEDIGDWDKARRLLAYKNDDYNMEQRDEARRLQKFIVVGAKKFGFTEETWTELISLKGRRNIRIHGDDNPDNLASRLKTYVKDCRQNVSEKEHQVINILLKNYKCRGFDE